MIFVLVAVVVTSCATTNTAGKSESELAGYTLKNKKELMHQKVLHAKKKTVMTTP